MREGTSRRMHVRRISACFLLAVAAVIYAETIHWPREGARMALLGATRQVLRNGFAILGISAPDSMSRDGGEEAAT